jgi:hypothetical protein
VPSACCPRYWHGGLSPAASARLKTPQQTKDLQ